MANQPRPKRVRRSPDEARTLILDAADRVFATHLPDAVGLKEIAREAGVSHGLVTHYFGTYDALVSATLQRRIERLRDAMAEVVMRAAAGGELADLDLFAEHRRAIAAAAREPATARLAVWAVMSGKAEEGDFFPARIKGLKLLVDALVARGDYPDATREDIELALIVQTAFVIVWSFGKNAIAGAMGKKLTPEMAKSVEERLPELLAGYLRRPRVEGTS
ncbi:MAG: TetR/AcrR family transcriptional regulator [Myxococcales bacterium]|nr:TetR/AcrR family transcriptional regulator [Myxococcales bacterium]